MLAPPAAVVRKAAAALKIGKVTRRGRTVTVKGTAAKTATGTVTVTVAGVKKRVKLARGAWTAKVTLKRAPRKSYVVSAAYAGDAAHLAATAKKTGQITHQSRGDSGASGTGPRVRGAAHCTALASTRWMSGWW